jgi:HEAT repeat protein
MRIRGFVIVSWRGGIHHGHCIPAMTGTISGFTRYAFSRQMTSSQTTISSLMPHAFMLLWMMAGAMPARGDEVAAEPVDQALQMFLPDPATATRLQPVIERLEAESFVVREEASRTLRALPALPGFIRQLARTEARAESRIRLRELVAAFPLEAENAALTRLLQQSAATATKGRLDTMVQVMRAGIWSPSTQALHDAARATATSADLPLITRCLDDPSPVFRRIATAAFGGLPPAEADPTLARLLDDGDAATALLAAAALAARKDTRCLATYARLLDAGDFITRYHSHAALRGLTGEDFAYDPTAEAAERKAAAGKWRDWVGSSAAAITGSLPRDSAIALCNDHDLQGWMVMVGDKQVAQPSSWEVKDGIIRCTGKEPGDLWTASRHENFVLTMEYLCAAAGSDSGVGLLLTEAEERGANGPGYLEVQLLPGKVGDIYQIGSVPLEVKGKPVQFISPRIAEVADPPGQWHRLRLTVRGGAVEVVADGVVVNRTDKGPRGPGRIVLRNERMAVSFRGLLLLPLDAPAGSPPSPAR